MPSTLTDRITVVEQAIVDLLKSQGPSLDPAVPAADVWYGDQNLIPRTPAITVEAGPYDKEIVGVGGKGRVDNTFRVYVIVYLAKLQDINVTRKDANELAEQVMDKLHTDITFGGLLIHSHVQTIEPGFAVRGKVTMRAARLTWTGLTRMQIT